MKKKVHIIGIAGKSTAALAKLFQEDLGWKVTGSDQEKIYDPAAAYLKKNKIKCLRGYREENLSADTDLVIVGGSSLILDPNNPEYQKAKRLKIPLISHSQALAKFLIKPESVCVAGTYGKTGTTALVTWILEKAGKNPTYFIGEQPNNFADYLRLTTSPLSVIEADEYAYRQIDFDSGPKFLNYKVKFAIITAASWEHKDVYSSEREYVRAFQDFVKLIPSHGLLVANLRGENIKQVVSSAQCPVQYYSTNKNDPADWKLAKIEFKKEGTEFSVLHQGKIIDFKIPLIGRYNIENTLAAIALTYNLGVDFPTIRKALRDFKGVKRRLESWGNPGGVWFYDDFAQSAIRVKAALKALRNRFKKEKILVIFDPHAGFLQKKSALKDYRGAFADAQQVFITKVTFRKNTPPTQRATGRDFVKIIGRGKTKASYIPIDEEVVKKVEEAVNQSGVVVFMSSGGLRGENIKKEIYKRLKRRS